MCHIAPTKLTINIPNKRPNNRVPVTISAVVKFFYASRTGTYGKGCLEKLMESFKKHICPENCRRAPVCEGT
jgi:hypothetical protein